MYNNPLATAAPVAAGSALAMTGGSSVWLALGGFALLAAGAAVMRTIPRRQAVAEVAPR